MLWVALAVGSAIVMMAASRNGIRNSVEVAERLHVSPFIIGITLVALGTDCPEITNSIVSSYLGKGDINVGDSIGSVFTQCALILGLFPFVAGGTIAIDRKEIMLTMSFSIFSLSCGSWLMRDALISHGDGLALLVLWILGSGLVWRLQV
ncbi:MAG: hypothetical protein AB7F75_02825, partial [Planctomycetota bacterium]